MSQFTTHTDVQIFSLVKGGSIEAFDELYNRYWEKLVNYTYHRTHSRDVAYEIVQDIFESIWTRHTTLRVNSLRFYLISMAKYKIIRYFQHNAVKRKYQDHYRAFEVVYDTLEDQPPNAETIQKLIDKSLIELPERCQLAFRLRLHENLSNTDIARRMNITKKTVEVYMFQAFKHLRASCRSHSEQFGL